MIRTRARGIPRLLAALGMAGAVAASGGVPAAAAGPNIVSQWNKIAEDTVVGAGAQQLEGFQYLAYTQLAVYDAVVAIEGGYTPYGPAVEAPDGASTDAAVVQAAYETLVEYFPGAATALDTARTTSLALIDDGQAEDDGIEVGHDAA